MLAVGPVRGIVGMMIDAFEIEGRWLIMLGRVAPQRAWSGIDWVRDTRIATVFVSDAQAREYMAEFSGKLRRAVRDLVAATPYLHKAVELFGPDDMELWHELHGPKLGKLAEDYEREHKSHGIAGRRKGEKPIND